MTNTWTRRVSSAAFWVAVLAVLVAFVAMTLARYDIVGKLPGFRVFMYMVPVAGAAAVLGVVALVMNWRARWPAAGRAAGAILIGGGAFAAASLALAPAREVPPIHDITTDLANPPEFAVLQLPADNLRGVETTENWRELHQQGYGDLTGLVVDQSPAQVVAKAQALARDRGWTIAAAMPERGRLEAVAYASYIRFEDIVVLRAVPTGDGRTRVDMRSVSRVGISDVGENAKRIREFLQALQDS